MDKRTVKVNCLVWDWVPPSPGARSASKLLKLSVPELSQTILGAGSIIPNLKLMVLKTE